MSYYTVIIVILIIVAMAIIGYLADREGFISNEENGEPKKDKFEEASEKEKAKEEKARLKEEEKEKRRLEKEEKEKAKEEAAEQKRLAKEEAKAAKEENGETDAFAVLPNETVEVSVPAPEAISEEEIMPAFEMAEPIAQVNENATTNEFMSDLGIFGEESAPKAEEDNKIEEIFTFEEVPAHDVAEPTGMEFAASEQANLNVQTAIADDMIVKEPVKTEEAVDDVWKF